MSTLLPRTLVVVVAAMFLAPATTGRAQPHANKVPIILDTDIGGDLDDALGLALALSSPEVELRGITTVHGDAHTRALLVSRLLFEINRESIPVAAGSPGRNPPDIAGQLQYGLRPCFRKRPGKEDAVAFLYSQLKADPGKITIVATGPLTNVAKLLEKHPDCKPWIKRLVVMAGSLEKGYKGTAPAEAEWNVKEDAKSARAVFESGVPLTVVPLDATATLKFRGVALDKVLEHGTALTSQMLALSQLKTQADVVLFDPAAVAAAFEEKFFKFEEKRIEVDDRGMTLVKAGKANARVAVSTDREAFTKWFAERLTPGKATPLVSLQATNVSKPVEQGKMPLRIHAFEDFETNIEKRWWLCGVEETANVPPGGGKRCLRGVMTNDFDDRQGDAKGMYTAVIFNPVPGPPMGKNTRLSFHCFLKGTDKVRVQLYSLTNGYHRHLTLTDVPQEKWQHFTVDMTKMRRPDGSGGPLSENERIDDIQFYTDPQVELTIDNIVLHDAAPPEEKRPFPTRLLFTGWFDTGAQGKEWPGKLEIVPHEAPLTWKAARSIEDAETKEPVLRVHLRGERPVGATARLRFRYHLTGADSLRVLLVNTQTGQSYPVAVKEPGQGQWKEETIEFKEMPRQTKANEIHFVVPKGGRLMVDDLLLY